jgi:hypothetical protein
MKKLILSLVICFVSVLHAQQISKSSIDSGGANVSAGGIQMIYTLGEVHVQESSAGNIQVSEGFINPAFFDNALSIAELSDLDSQIVVYPNPTAAKVTVSTHLTITTLTLYDINGKALFSLSNKNQMDLSALSNGAYLLRIISDKGVITKKIIVNK